MIINGGTRWTRFFLEISWICFFLAKSVGGGGKRSGKNRVTAYQGILAHNCNNK